MRNFSGEGVLREAIAAAVTTKKCFAYADGYDEGAGRYLGLVFGERPITSMHEGLVAQRGKVLEQLAFDHVGDDDGGNASDEGVRNSGGTVPSKSLFREVELDKLTAGYQVGSIVEEICSSSMTWMVRARS